MKKLFKPLGVAVLAASLMLTGCASGGNSGGGGGDGDDSGIAVLAAGRESAHLNVDILSDEMTAMVSSLWGEQLFELDQDGNIVPKLSTEWEVSEDGLEYTFHLQEGVKWHDGEPFTAEDVKYTLETTLPLGPRTTVIADYMTGVEVVDDHTAVLTLSQPYAPLMTLLSTFVVMLPAHIYEGTDITSNPTNSAPIGTGPYRFVSWDKGQQLRFERNDDYWQADLPKLEGVVVRFVSDPTTRMNGLVAGELDFISGGGELSGQQAKQLIDNASITTIPNRQETHWQLGFNTTRAPFDNVLVRQALAHAIDRQQIIDQAFNGNGYAPETVIPDTYPNLIDTDLTYEGEYPLDLDAAGKLLDEAGYPADANGHRMNILLTTSAGEQYLNPANVIKAQLAKIGIDVEISSTEEQSFSNRTYVEFDYDIYFSNYGMNSDPGIGLNRMFTCTNIGIIYGNATGWCNEEVDGLLSQTLTSVTNEERAAAYADATKIILEEIPRITVVVTSDPGFVRGGITDIDKDIAKSSNGRLNWLYSSK